MNNLNSELRTPQETQTPNSQRLHSGGRADWRRAVGPRPFCLAAVWLGAAVLAHAQPAIVSTVPANLASEVSLDAPVVIVFSETMNPGATMAQFMDPLTFTFLPATPVWSAGDTMLTCMPVAAWPANKMIVWFVEGENSAGDPLEGEAGGMFTTGGSSGGTCTNDVGALTLGKGALYQQSAADAPALNTNAPYIFVACGTLACSNLPAAGLNLTVPGGPAMNVPATPIPGHYNLSDLAASLPVLEGDYPNGNYSFTVQGGAGSPACTVNFPASLAMPNAPRLTNLVAAQAIHPTQPFVLGWEAFPGAGPGDGIQLEIYGGVFQTPSVGALGLLPGTARSVTIPAGTLEPNRAYDGALTFYDLVLDTNACGYVTLVYCAATTEFTLTTASDAPRLTITRTPTNTVVVAWPAPAAGWMLERTGALPSLPVSWPQVTPPYQTDGATFWMTFTNLPPTGNHFFRLHQP